MIKFSVTQNGIILDPSKYNWDENTKVFSSKENDLVLDFGNESGITFKTGSYCTFTTGPYCTFKTGHGCTFNTGSDCTFNTGYSCTFTTGKNCFGIRYDVAGVTIIPELKTIKYNGYEVEGYSIEEKKFPCEGKIVEIDGIKYKLQPEK